MSDTLRVGLVAPVPPPNGGMAMQARQLRRLLEDEGMEIAFLPTNSPYRPAWIGRFRGLRALARLLPYIAGVWRLTRQVNVIHLMANSGWAWHLFAAPVLWLAPLAGTPVIVNYRGGEAEEFFARAFKWVKPSLRRAAQVVVPSGYLEQVFEEHGEKVKVIPNIVDTGLFRPVKERPRHAGFVFAITRNLEPIYGIDTALRALAMVPESLEARFAIAGSGPAESTLRDLAKELGVDDRVEFLGRLERDAIVALYEDADAMLNPTTVDNMPNSLLEAMASGLPVVSTNVGGVPFLVRDGESALLVPANDPARMATAMQRLMEDTTLRDKIAETALTQVKAYTWSVVYPQWLAAYRAAGVRP
jgi:glycosyltransferase involved in cell wall biosynthesis